MTDLTQAELERAGDPIKVALLACRDAVVLALASVHDQYLVNASSGRVPYTAARIEFEEKTRSLTILQAKIDAALAAGYTLTPPPELSPDMERRLAQAKERLSR